MSWKDLRFIFKPSYWIMNHQYSERWDCRLNELMEKHDFVLDRPNPISGVILTAFLGDVEVWVANHPYASFRQYDLFGRHGRPSRDTIEKAHKKLLADTNAALAEGR